MASARPAINVVEKSPCAPRPYVFTEMALCLRDSIRAAGYPSEHLQNRIDPAALSIVMGAFPENAHELEHLDPARCAIFNFEQLGSTSAIANPAYRQWLSGWVVLDYHASNLEILRRENGSRQMGFELPVVPSESVMSLGDEPKDVDVLFFGSPSERRTQVLQRMEALGLKVMHVAGAYGQELAPALRRARIVLHVHYYETGLFPVARIAQPVMMRVPIVCEKSVFSDLNDWSHSGIVFADYADLAETCREFIDAPERMAVRARMARSFVQQIDFATPFAQMVGAMEKRAAGVAACAADEDSVLSHDEIVRILEAEGAGLPPEADAPAPPPVALVERQPGKGPHGKWWLALLIIFSIFTLWNMLKG